MVKVQALTLLLGAISHTSALKLMPPRPPKLGGKDHYGEDPNAVALQAAAPIGRELDRSGWRVTCDSYETGNECEKAIDGDNNSFWHTNYDVNGGPQPPHTITVDMGQTFNINGVSVKPRQDGNNHGLIARHELYVSTDKNNWEKVAYGAWHADPTDKFANFEAKSARYFKLVALTEINGNPWTSIAELQAFQSQNGPAQYAGTGRWGPTINFPTVPVAGVVNPLSGVVTIWSAYAYDNYLGSTFDRVFTSSWNMATNVVEPKLVDNTDHDMFCPGISITGNGQMIVTGGNSAKKSTLFDFNSGSWNIGPEMNIPRGYQSSATTSDGKVFTIGGSWSGGNGGKNGEIYDPRARSWKNLPGADVTPMLTNDKDGVYRADNHAWLFGWKSGTVFQAGPSKAMNWYYTSGSGSYKGAGTRRSYRGDDEDSMTGNAVMFDAVKGKILAFGGSPSYQDTNANAHAHLITLKNPGDQVDVTFASNGLWYPRAFHTSVVLPNGQVFITGGQTYAVPFNDDNSDLTPEMYNPDQDNFIKMAPNSIIRVYHSIALLLPDGTVFSAGGGLCGDCNTNHFDGQVFTPPYLLNSNGSPATRPVIQRASTDKRTVTFTTDSAVSSASLVRFGTATHTVNTDQRRVPLTITSTGKNSYRADLPTDSGVLLPGYYMLFVMNDKGVPSVSKTLDLTN
ncbi:hypothetical protein VHEMI07786 [[Torrubiella] hemipterigena]|uniref:F5/8 type C domain-containing protein n=1 Tax=[Torrubiella] hemipterigena TaxID=1531966 RepID=A0A0A1TMB5_9HYPO|nr:hypothetical protein VHEMI07786 [[Torrubiella] hemipterigena]